MKSSVIFLSAVFLFSLMVVSCTKEGAGYSQVTPINPNPIPNGVYTLERELDILNFQCGLKKNYDHDYKVNDEYLFYLDDCDRYLRFDSNLIVKDWVGFDNNGEFGIHDISVEKNDSFPAELIDVTNDKFYYKVNDTLFSYNFNTKDAKVFSTSGVYGLVTSDEKIIVASDQSGVKRFNKNGWLDFSYEIPYIIDYSQIELDEEDNLYVLIGNSGTNVILKFDKLGNQVFEIKGINGEKFYSIVSSYDHHLYIGERSNGWHFVQKYNYEGKKIKSYECDSAILGLYNKYHAKMFNGKYIQENQVYDKHGILKLVE